MKNIIKVMMENELFKNISEEKLTAILSQIDYSIKKYEKGQIIAQEDDHCENLALVISGMVEIQRLYPSGNYIVLNRLTDGDVFGEALVFSKKQVYPATVISVNESSILFIDRKDILKLCSSEDIILENFISLLSDKVFILNSKIKSISFKTVKQKVINFILQESRNQKANKIILKGSKEEIAASIGIPRPSLSRELINLRDTEYIEFDRKTITILKAEELEEELFD